MRGFGRYDREMWGGGRGYDRGYRPRGYDGGYAARPYDRGYRDAPFPRGGRGPGYPPPYDATGWAPFAFTPFAFDPTLGWAGWGGDMGFVPPRRMEEERPRRIPPRESPMYGRGGDRAVRQWAERYGYDVEHTIRPRRGPRYP
jgi:hypothetical protein